MCCDVGNRLLNFGLYKYVNPTINIIYTLLAIRPPPFVIPTYVHITNLKSYIRLYRLCISCVWLLLCGNCMCRYIGVSGNRWVLYLKIFWLLKLTYIYSVEWVIFLCTVHMSDILFRKCSVYVHSTRFLYNVYKLFCFCAQCIVLITLIWDLFK